MILANSLLAKCERLKQVGIEFEVKVGVGLARGFADLGYEQFCLLPNKKLLSLFTGAQSEFLNDGNYFVVPSTDDLLSVCCDKRVPVKDLDFNNNQQWIFTLQDKSFTNISLYELLIDVLIARAGMDDV